MDKLLICGLSAILLIALPADAHAADDSGPADLKRLSIEELMHVEVTSASKKPEQLADTAAAVYVITNDDIRRSGATTLAAALRLVPGVHVARVNGNKWAIGIRGFTSQLSRSLLVLIDGRSVYTPLFAGVFWEVQDTLLEDVERIEVIRGPGGTLWGANAVNGVINIITKSAQHTQGTYASAGGGSEERAFGGARYGGHVGDALFYRLYGKGYARDGGFSRDIPDFDGSEMGQGGFRLDWAPADHDRLTVQGDYYDGDVGTRAAVSTLTPPSTRIVDRDAHVSGGNVLGRWTRALREDAEATLQLYYDRTNRRDATFREDRDTFDLDFHHRFRAPYHQELIWGLGYRVSSGDAEGVPTIVLTPSRRTNHLASAFIQDELTLADGRLRFIAGSKIEYNDYSGVELQPNARVLFAPVPNHIVWGAISRAVRTPSRVEQDLTVTVPIDVSTASFARVVGDGRFTSESVIAYELGYRVQPISRLFVDVTTFYNDYHDVLSIERGMSGQEGVPPNQRTIFPFFIRNRLSGEVYGVELAADAALTDWWRLAASYSYLQIDLHREPGSTDVTSVGSIEGSSPQNQVALRSSLDLRWNLALDAMLRYIDNLPAQHVGSYLSLDVRLGWRPTRHLELAVVGQELLERHHAEFGGGGLGSVEIERGVYGMVTWRH